MESAVKLIINWLLGDYIRGGYHVRQLGFTKFELRGVAVKQEALEGLNLPIAVRHGIIGRLMLELDISQGSCCGN